METAAISERALFFFDFRTWANIVWVRKANKNCMRQEMRETRDEWKKPKGIANGIENEFS